MTKDSEQTVQVSNFNLKINNIMFLTNIHNHGIEFFINLQ